MRIKPWLQFFRLPNLPTAPGDALAGAAVVMAVAGGSLRPALVAGGAALLLYMYGLADNDIVGAAADAEAAPERPIPRGEISLRQARVARSACLFGALLLAALFGLPPAWWLVATALTGTICLYNRVKGLWLMGLCRGLSVLCGAAAALPPKFVWTPSLGAVGAVALGWTLYIAAVTKLSEGEERASAGLGAGRYLLGVAALMPLAAGIWFPDPRMWLLPALGCVWAWASWCVSVWPLGAAHGPELRRRAVGQAICAVFYLQVGFMLVAPNRDLVAVAAALWLAMRFIRRRAPSICGS
ncbi:MAG: UbiA family prenyltransferase [Kiritimatiellia bacterium]